MQENNQNIYQRFEENISNQTNPAVIGPGLGLE